MRSNDENNLTMQIVVRDFVKEATPEQLAAMPDLESANSALGNNIDLLRRYKNGQVLNRTGNRINKQQVRDEMSQTGYSIAAKVCSYAMKTRNEVLEQEVNYTYSDLTGMRDTDVADTCLSIHAIAKAHLEALAPYGITEESLASYKALIELYNEVMPTTRAGVVEKSAYTALVKKILKINRGILAQMDKQVETVRFTDPDFYFKYKRSRRIVDLGIRHLSLRGKVVDELGAPINNVLVSIELKDATISAKTTLKGNYQFKHVEQGMWPVLFTRVGYEPVKDYIVITPNTRVDFDVVMKAATPMERTA